jgi:hypothetical protein
VRECIALLGRFPDLFLFSFLPMRCRRTVDLLGEKRMELTVAGTAADLHRIPVLKIRSIMDFNLPTRQIYRLFFVRYFFLDKV